MKTLNIIFIILGSILSIGSITAIIYGYFISDISNPADAISAFAPLLIIGLIILIISYLNFKSYKKKHNISEYFKKTKS